MESESKPDPQTRPYVFKFFPPHILKNNFMPPHIGTFGVCPNTRADTKANPKRANFADPPNNDNLLKTFNTFFVTIR